jgi:hypothetical protein
LPDNANDKDGEGAFQDELELSDSLVGISNKEREMHFSEIQNIVR